MFLLKTYIKSIYCKTMMIMRDDYKKYIKSLLKYLVDKGYSSKPYPKIVLDDSNQEGIFIKTGYYNPETKEIRLFTNGRHIKDVLRSCAHEMIHHKQNLDGRLSEGSYNGDLIIEDDKLMGLEKEAFLNGNIGFREWTEHVSKK